MTTIAISSIEGRESNFMVSASNAANLNRVSDPHRRIDQPEFVRGRAIGARFAEKADRVTEQAFLRALEPNMNHVILPH
jgi:hypothetical protein